MCLFTTDTSFLSRNPQVTTLKAVGPWRMKPINVQTKVSRNSHGVICERGARLLIKSHHGHHHPSQVTESGFLWEAFVIEMVAER